MNKIFIILSTFRFRKSIDRENNNLKYNEIEITSTEIDFKHAIQ
jgi:hypothetical protein